MAKYTVELDELIQSGFNLGMTVADFPLFNEAYRETLVQKIIDHYRFREIGFETPARFKFYLNRTLREIMPLYNQYYAQAANDYSEYFTKDYLSNEQTETYTRTTDTVNHDDVVTHGIAHNEGATGVTGTGTDTDITDGTVTQTTHDFKKDFDTPRAPITEINDYITKAAQDDATVTDDNDTTVTKTTNTQTDGTSTSDGTTHVTDTKDGTKVTTETLTHSITEKKGLLMADNILKYRQTFINIDMMVINELNTCFMCIY